ncbi:hypothetical protein P3T37_005811 [Kitasatospora sp. MAA4]|uniref:hypothetical protein n=1 Tax=Kitasatospora sp. MAA4 TaxID=3035093 RepID=UPI002476B50B|nr:hypothetical protein [Kitasatospora sp. MAA4]MDH6136386.1 hypothetical protein [Kitasatospora sp. MAA4]
MAGHYPEQFGPPPGQPRVPPGPFGVPAKVLLSLLPVVTAGLLGFVPALLLARRRRRGVDVAAVVVFGCLLALMMVCGVIAGQDKRQVVANGIGMGTMVVLIFVPPVHFLLMDRRAVWGAPVVPVAPPYYPMAGYPGYQPQQPQQPVDELQQLGELLRRQAEGGGGR